MKRVIILLSILLLLGAFSFFTLKSSGGDKTSVVLEDREFIVEDSDEINIVTIETPGYPMKHLSRQKNHWLFNNSQKVEPNIMQNMMRVLSKMTINYIPPRTMYPTINDGFERIGLTIKTYDKKGKVLSEFLMGGNTQEEDGTFCKRLGYDQVYVMTMPTSVGGLRAYFNQSQEQLRSKTVFDIKHEDIKEISLEYHKDKQNSFSVTRKGGNMEIAAPFNESLKSEKANPKLLDAYFKDFDKVAAEAIRTGHPSMDSIRNFLAFADLKIRMENDEEISLAFYPDIDLFRSDISTQKVEDVFRVERHFVFDGKGEVYVVQQRMLHDIFKKPDFFFR